MQNEATKLKQVFVSIPMYEGKLCAVTVASFFNDLPRAAEAGIYLHLDPQIGSSDLPFVRGMGLSRFLASGMDEWVGIDWDVGWEPGGLVRLLQHEVDFVMGVYPKRQDRTEFVVSFPGGKMVRETNGLARIVAGPAGFYRVTRSAMERMIGHYRELNFRNEDSPTLGKIWGVFEKHISGGERISEDISFVKRWVDMGETAWVDPTIRMYHAGMKIWEGCLLEHEALKCA